MRARETVKTRIPQIVDLHKEIPYSTLVGYANLLMDALGRILEVALIILMEPLVLVEGGSVPIRGCLVVVPNSDLHPLGDSFA